MCLGVEGEGACWMKLAKPSRDNDVIRFENIRDLSAISTYWDTWLDILFCVNEDSDEDTILLGFFFARCAIYQNGNLWRHSPNHKNIHSKVFVFSENCQVILISIYMYFISDTNTFGLKWSIVSGIRCITHRMNYSGLMLHQRNNLFKTDRDQKQFER